MLEEISIMNSKSEGWFQVRQVAGIKVVENASSWEVKCRQEVHHLEILNSF